MTTPAASAGVSYLLDTIKALERRTSCLLEVARFVRETHDLHELLGRLLAKAAELVGADAGVIALVDPDSSEFRFVNIHYASLPPMEAGKKEKALQEVRLKLTDGIIGQVHASGEPRIVSDISSAAEMRKDVADSVDYEVRNLIAVPLAVDGDKLGAVEFLNKTAEGAFTALDLDLASAVANQIALVLEAHRLRESAAGTGKAPNEARESLVKAEKDLEESRSREAEGAATLKKAETSLEEARKGEAEAKDALKKISEERDSLRKERDNIRSEEVAWKEQKDSIAAVVREETARRTAAEQALKEARESAAKAEETASRLTQDVETAFRLQEKNQRKIEELTRALEEEKTNKVRPLEHRAALMRAFSAVSSNQPTEIVLETLLNTISSLLDAEAASLLLTDEESGRLYFAAATGGRKDPLKKVLLNEGEGIAGWVAKNGRVLNIPDVARDPRFSDQADKSADFKTRSILAVPLFSDGRLIGVAEAVNKKEGGAFSEDDAQSLIAVSLYAAMVIRKSQIYWDMNELFLSTVRALADAVEAKGAGGKGRSERMRRLALALSDEMSLPAAERRDLELAALLQDVGKVILPEHILRKPEGLTEEEALLLARAPVVAAEILAPAKPLKNVVPIVRHVHERWDGLGYPDKLKGDAIPAGARALAVAAAFETMTADRPYRRRLPDEVALKEIESLRGVQLDPAAVDALTRLYRKGKLKDLFK